jgi:hypothetical protein
VPHVVEEDARQRDVPVVLARLDLPPRQRGAVRLVRPAEEGEALRGPPVSSWKSRVRSRCSSRSSSVSSKPITMVAVVRSPASTTARCASKYWATVYLNLACRFRKSSVRISEPPPVIQCTPASLQLARGLQEESRAVGQVHELGDGERVELHPVAVALAHGAEEVAVVVQRQLRVEAAVEAHQVAARAPAARRSWRTRPRA